jgi:hypothetical protein
MTPLTFIVAIGIFLSLPKLAFMSLEYDGATKKFDFDFQSMTIATAIGSLAVWMCLIGTEVSFIDRSLMIMLGGLLSLGAWIDRISAWAPDIIMLPFCVAIFLLAPEVDGLRSFAAALGFGVALFLSGILLWIPQDAFDKRFAPPADLIAIAAPFVLFRISYETAMIFSATSVCLLTAMKSPTIAAVFSRPEAVQDGASELSFGNEPAVTFLSVIFPITLIAVVVDQLSRFVQ